MTPFPDGPADPTFLDLSRPGEDEILLKKECHRLATEVIRPAARTLDRMAPGERVAPGSPYFSALGHLKSLGYHRMFLPPEVGGIDPPVSPLARAIFLEELGWGSLGLATAFGVDMLPFVLIAMFGSERLKTDLLAPWVDDTEGALHGCWGATEPDHGSDAVMSLRDPTAAGFARPQAVAVPDGDGWRIRGQKAAWVSSAPVATHCALHVQVEGEADPLHGMFAIVPLDLPGVSRGQPIAMLGARDDPQCEIFFDDVALPADHLLVASTPFYGIFVDQLLCATSATIANIAVGVARAAFEEALAYARRRVQGGVPIAEHKNVQLTLYGMFEKIETARCYARQVLSHIQGETVPGGGSGPSTPGAGAAGGGGGSGMMTGFGASPRHSRAAQIYAKRIAFEVANDALQVCGAYGLTEESLTEKLFRDARSLWIEDGTLEVLSLDAARDLISNYETDRYVPEEVMQRW